MPRRKRILWIGNQHWDARNFNGTIGHHDEVFEDGGGGTWPVPVFMLYPAAQEAGPSQPAYRVTRVRHNALWPFTFNETVQKLVSNVQACHYKPKTHLSPKSQPPDLIIIPQRQSNLLIPNPQPQLPSPLTSPCRLYPHHASRR